MMSNASNATLRQKFAHEICAQAGVRDARIEQAFAELELAA